MAGRAKWMLVTLAALPLAMTAARAQNSEYDSLPRPGGGGAPRPPPPPPRGGGGGGGAPPPPRQHSQHS
jgi:hypothetical protein